jgi:hypothetical protein
MWRLEFKRFLGDLGYRPSAVDPALFVRRAGEHQRAIIFTHADDTAGTGPQGEISREYSLILAWLEGRLLGEVSGGIFLGMQHRRDRKRLTISISQPLLIHDMRERLVSDGHVCTVSTPLVARAQFFASCRDSGGDLSEFASCVVCSDVLFCTPENFPPASVLLDMHTCSISSFLAAQSTLQRWFTHNIVHALTLHPKLGWSCAWHAMAKPLCRTLLPLTLLLLLFRGTRRRVPDSTRSILGLNRLRLWVHLALALSPRQQHYILSLFLALTNIVEALGSALLCSLPSTVKLADYSVS